MGKGVVGQNLIRGEREGQPVQQVRQLGDGLGDGIQALKTQSNLFLPDTAAAEYERRKTLYE